MTNGTLSQIEYDLRWIIASSENFQEGVGAETPEDALEKVYFAATPRQIVKPCAYLHTLQDVSYRHISLAGSQPYGTALVTFIASAVMTEVDPQGSIDDYEAAMAAATDWVHLVLDDVELLGRSGGYISINNWQITLPEDIEGQARRALDKVANATSDVTKTAQLDYGLVET